MFYSLLTRCYNLYHFDKHYAHIIRRIFLNLHSILNLLLDLSKFCKWVLKILVVIYGGSSPSLVYRYENFHTSRFISRFTLIRVGFDFTCRLL